MAKRISFQPVKHYWRGSRWHKLLVILVATVAVCIGLMYGVAQWYIHTERSKPLEMGVSFIPDYAQSLGVDPEENLDELLNIGVRHFRLVSYWSDMEQTPGTYDFSQLDWQFEKAEAKHAKIILTLGLRQPRWPECHAPKWADITAPSRQWQPQLEQFMQAVIERYKDSPSLDSYQLENEFFLAGFGICTNVERSRLVSEFKLVKRLDPSHPVIISRSNNDIGLPVGQPQPDVFSISIYKRVWDAAVTRRYMERPFPAWYYGFSAGLQRIFNHRDMIITELQAEAWAPNLKSVQDVSLDEQNKSLNAKRLQDRIKYGKATGMRGIYLWGAEYWYYRKEVLHDPSLWSIARQEFTSTSAKN